MTRGTTQFENSFLALCSCNQSLWSCPFRHCVWLSILAHYQVSHIVWPQDSLQNNVTFWIGKGRISFPPTVFYMNNYLYLIRAHRLTNFVQVKQRYIVVPNPVNSDWTFTFLTNYLNKSACAFASLYSVHHWTVAFTHQTLTQDDGLSLVFIHDYLPHGSRNFGYAVFAMIHEKYEK